MAQITQPAKPPFIKIINFLRQPQQVFEEIIQEEKPNWQIPMLVLSISTTLSIIVSGTLIARAASMGEVQLPPDWQWWTPDMQNNYMQAQQSMQGPVFTYIIPLVGALLGLWFGWLILGGLLHFGSTIFGGRASMQKDLTITAWASLPFLMRDILRIFFMLIVGHAIQNPGLSGFAENSAFLAQLLSRLDLFFIWMIILLIIGLRQADNLPRTKTITNVLIVSLLILLLSSGIGAILSSASGFAI